ncbi:DUF4190 domain-containing protein [Imperialibacter roseus]|uniref:DUF4190 domain-containing protein n=1 Tax=Imperialibacter roseus TaxID=1324217 RepID=A0ABZ0INS9_9BACT|nr:DUF4190 domain-containing protein [Imperialibacter roseus]WOK06703.1 DUF4190 domain-containing protein [Imperialibacter roseus]
MPFSKQSEKSHSNDFIPGAEEEDPFFDTLTYFEKEQEKEALYSPEFKAKNLNLGLAGMPSDSSIVPIDPEILKSDTSQLSPKNSAIQKTSGLAQISFFAGIGTILLFLLPLDFPVFGAILFLSSAAMAMITGLIAIRRIVKKNQQGRGMAVFGMSIGTLVLFILTTLTLYAYIIDK